MSRFNHILPGDTLHRDVMSSFNLDMVCTILSGRTGSENKKTVTGALKPNEIQDFESLH